MKSRLDMAPLERPDVVSAALAELVTPTAERTFA
jgi:hypothetical protein